MNNAGASIAAYGSGPNPIIDNSGITTADSAIYISASGCSVSDVTLTDTEYNSTTACAIIAVNSTGTGVTIAGNTIVGNAAKTGRTGGWRGINVNCGGAFTVSNNLVYNIPGDGIQIEHSAGIVGTVVGNTIHTCYAAGQNYSQDGIRVLGGDFAYGTLVSGNHIYNCSGDGIDTVTATNLIIESNTIHDQHASASQGNGIKACGNGASGNLVRANHIYNMTKAFTYGILFNQTANVNTACAAYGNYVHDCWGGIAVYADATDMVVKFNTLKGITNKAFNVQAAATSHTFQANIVESAVSEIDVGAGATVTGGGNHLVYNKTSISGTYNGTDQTGDPLWASDGATLPLSTTRAAGTWVAGVLAFDGIPLPLHPDIGAVQDRDYPGRKTAVSGTL